MAPHPLPHLVVAVKGAGEMASAVAWRLFRANLCRIFMMETQAPLAVRRLVSFCEAVHDGKAVVEGVEAVLAEDARGVQLAWDRHRIAVLVDPQWRHIGLLRPDVVVDAILAKRNLGTAMDEAPLVIALGPGFEAGRDAHFVIETNRGHNLGRVMASGRAEPDTGVPGEIGGRSSERVLRAPAAGTFLADSGIGAMVRPGEAVGRVGAAEVRVEMGGVLRGLIRSGTPVEAGLKIGDIDPRGKVEFCGTISDKARAISGSVLEAILRVCNR